MMVAANSLNESAFASAILVSRFWKAAWTCSSRAVMKEFSLLFSFRFCKRRLSI